MFEQLDSWLHKRNTQTGWRVGSHVLFWLAFFSSLVYFNSISFNTLRGTPLVYLNPLRLTITLILIFYPLVYLIGEKLFRRKRWVAAILASLGLLLLYTLIDYTGEQMVLHYCETCRQAVAKAQPNYYYYLNRGFLAVVSSRVVSLGAFFTLLVYITPALAFKAGLAYHRQYIQNLKLSRDNIQLELNFLKAQVNPHFLFNTLNNLYGLIIHGRNEQSAETVARLSDFMRYSLYDSTAEKVPLEKEINLIRNYLELEKLRLNHTQVIFNCATDGKAYAIPPLLFMPLIENAFKYNLDSVTGAVIQINLAVQQNILDFCIHNTFDPKREKGKVGGIGLANLRKRLALYFPGKNTCQTGVTGTTYSAQLTLTLA